MFSTRLKLAVKPATLLYVLSGMLALMICLLLVNAFHPLFQKDRHGEPAAVSGGEISSLRKQVHSLEGRVRKLTTAESRVLSNDPAILVDSSQNKITLIQGTRIIAQGTCSTGNGMELTDNTGRRSWTFDTPRGYFRVLGKVTNPVWYRPDWSFIEEGEPVPKDRASRAMPDVLGDYALAFGNGYFIHGTLYTRLLGTNVTHGCIRVNDDMLKKLYDTARPGTPIWIY